MTKRTCVFCAAVIAALALPAGAQPRGGPGHEGPERRDLPGKPGDPGKPGAPGKPADLGRPADPGKGGDRADAGERGKKEARDGGDAARRERAMERLKRPREARRGEHQDQIRQKWGGEAVRNPALRNELRAHAWRLARLTRLQSLAEAENNDAVIARIEALLAKENARHERRMAELGSKAATPGQAKDAGGPAAPSGKGKPPAVPAASKGGAK